MTTYAYTLTNPGAELGNTTGWTSRSGGVPAAGADASAHGGAYRFIATASGATAKWDQQVAVDPAHEAGIDAGTWAVRARAWHSGFTDADSGALYIECYASDGTTLLGREEAPQSDPSTHPTWTQQYVVTACPVGTRYFRIGTYNVRASGTELSAYWDDFELDASDAPATDFPVPLARITGLGAEVVYAAATHQARVTGLAAEVVYQPLDTDSKARISAIMIEVVRSVEDAPSTGRRRQMVVMG